MDFYSFLVYDIFMKFHPPLIPCTFIKRYKRFLADVQLNTGEVVQVHCPNPGSMKSCLSPGWKAMISDHRQSKRKLPYTLELIHNHRCWIGVNTQLANAIVYEALNQNLIPALSGYDTIHREVTIPHHHSRLDFCLENKHHLCYVEVKQVTLCEGNEYYFPDSVTKRGQKHLKVLMTLAKKYRAVMLYLILRQDGYTFSSAAHIDPEYAALLKEACHQSVEVLPLLTRTSPEGIEVTNKPLDFHV